LWIAGEVGSAFGVRPSVLLAGDPAAFGVDLAAYQAFRAEQIRRVGPDGLVFMTMRT
jgi:hypothetical protein